MRRRYTARTYVEVLDEIRSSVPNASITADVIAGFPGETESEFEETFALCDRVGFADMHVFPFSARPGTTAAYLDGHVRSDVKAGRVQALLSLAKRNATEFRKRFLGQPLPVLWEDVRRQGDMAVWSGLTDNYIRVAAQSSRDLGNQITMARLSRQEKDVVYARVL
jgi:threonylcarbamoyladenosine tRNA methylthiotransferase MtaB